LDAGDEKDKGLVELAAMDSPDSFVGAMSSKISCGSFPPPLPLVLLLLLPPAPDPEAEPVLPVTADTAETAEAKSDDMLS